MCGIVGVVTSGTNIEIAPRLRRMLSSQAHRGPDDEGTWEGTSCGARLGLGASRLKIIDLSAAGHQPMVSPDSRYVLTFNGEVYNYIELREELQSLGCEFRSTSDTEVVLQALRTWGPAALARFNGMWGLAFLDLNAGTLLLARDRFGVKPLYIYPGNGTFYFASEIKAILEASGERFEINPVVAARYLKQLRVDANDQTFFTNIVQVPAGHFITLKLGKPVDQRSAPTSYWSLDPQKLSGISVADQIERMRAAFIDAVRLRLRSDVPVGVLLSGGVDSSSIAAAVQELNGRDANLHLFSAVSDDPNFSEEPYVDIMAAHLGQPVEKVWLNQSAEQALALLEEATWFNDEPMWSFASVAQYLLMQRARERGVTVILSGQGADEMLLGYPPDAFVYLAQLIRHGRLDTMVPTMIGIARRGTVLKQQSATDVARFIKRRLPRAGTAILGSRLRSEVPRLPRPPRGRNLRAQECINLYRGSIPPIVHSEDRMSMAWSREVRNPFLDFRLVSLEYSLPGTVKLKDGWTKWILRKAMTQSLPLPIAWRKDKQGFVTPQARWLRYDLRHRIETMLDGEMLTARAGIVEQAALRNWYEADFARGNRYGWASWQESLHPLALEIWAQRFARFLTW